MGPARRSLCERQCRRSPSSRNDPLSLSPQPQLEISFSRQLPNFLAEQKLSLAVTTYQAGLSAPLRDGSANDGRHLLPVCEQG
jgi:hypothetical protein